MVCIREARIGISGRLVWDRWSSRFWESGMLRGGECWQEVGRHAFFAEASARNSENISALVLRDCGPAA